MTPFKKLSHQTRVLPGRIQNRRLAFLFVTLQERIDEKVNISRHLCLLLRYGSRFIVKYTKAAKAKLNHRSKLWLCSKALHSVRGLPYLLREPANFAPDHFLIGAVSPFTRPIKLYRFENSTLLKAFSKRLGPDNEFDRRRVNERFRCGYKWNRVLTVPHRALSRIRQACVTGITVTGFTHFDRQIPQIMNSNQK